MDTHTKFYKSPDPGVPQQHISDGFPVPAIPEICLGGTYVRINLLLAECEVRTAGYGPSFFLPFMAQARSARAMKTRKEKTRIHNLLYGPSRQG